MGICQPCKDLLSRHRKAARWAAFLMDATPSGTNHNMFAACPFPMNNTPAALAGVAVRASITKTTTIIKG